MKKIIFSLRIWKVIRLWGNGFFSEFFFQWPKLLFVHWWNPLSLKKFFQNQMRSSANFKIAIAKLKFASDLIWFFQNIFKDSGIHQWTKRSLGHFGKKIFEKAVSSSARLLFRFGEKNITYGLLGAIHLPWMIYHGWYRSDRRTY